MANPAMAARAVRKKPLLLHPACKPVLLVILLLPLAYYASHLVAVAEITYRYMLPATLLMQVFATSVVLRASWGWVLALAGPESAARHPEARSARRSAAAIPAAHFRLGGDSTAPLPPSR